MMIAEPGTIVRFAANHLWQSTLAACAVAAMALLLRKGEARSRHALWMAASLKFLVPFAAFTWLGERLSPAHAFGAPAPVLSTVLTIGQPFSGPLAPAGMKFTQSAPAAHFSWVVLIASLWAIGACGVLIAWIVRWTRVRTVVRHATAQLTGREADALRAAQIAGAIRRPIRLLVSQDCMEPGICGVFRPVLLWPAGISTHLDDAQLAAIVAHEVAHVQRRDNLFAVLHMCVEAVFWFHPLVWWMGARLLEERERACDEAVLRLGNEPARYADAILKACRFCVESPLPCVSGVSGSNLKRRMVQIMNAAAIPLSRSRKMLLASVAVAAIAGPIVFGAMHPRVVRADDAQDQRFAGLHFDSASLKPSQGESQGLQLIQRNNEFLDTDITMKDLIAIAYGVGPDRISGGPEWIGTQRFDFEARWTPTPTTTSNVPPPPAPEVSIATATMGPGHGPAVTRVPAPGVLQAMLRNFLAEQMNLRVREDSAVLPVYELVVANGGPKLTPTQTQPETNVTAVRLRTGFSEHVINGQEDLAVTNGVPRVLCDTLSNHLGREVVDKTGLTGRYDFTMSFPAQTDADQLASILRDHYGLDLQATEQPVKVFAIDNINKPENQ